MKIQACSLLNQRHENVIIAHKNKTITFKAEHLESDLLKCELNKILKNEKTRNIFWSLLIAEAAVLTKLLADCSDLSDIKSIKEIIEYIKNKKSNMSKHEEDGKSDDSIIATEHESMSKDIDTSKESKTDETEYIQDLSVKINLNKEIVIGGNKMTIRQLKATLEQMVEKGFTQRKMAEKLNTSAARINYYTQLFGFPYSNHYRHKAVFATITRGHKQWNIKDYVKKLQYMGMQGYSPSQIAKIMNTQVTQIYQDLKKYKVVIRPKTDVEATIIRGNKKWNKSEYYETLKMLAEEGYKQEQISKQLRISITQINQDLNIIGIKTVGVKEKISVGKKSWEPSEYVEKLTELAGSGYILREISEIMGVCIKTIHRDLKKLGITTQGLRKHSSIFMSSTK